MPSIKIGNKVIRYPGDEVYLIAELGQNHQGSYYRAEMLIAHASYAGFDCVKFQKSCPTAKFTKAALDRPHKCTKPLCTTYGEHKQYLEFSFAEYLDLKDYSKLKRVDFAASAMDIVSFCQLCMLNITFIKIGSGDANNFPLLEIAATSSVPLIISIGMQTMTTVERIVAIMRSKNKTNFVLMHCVSSYPTHPADASLIMIPYLRQKFPDVVIGYSGHELGMSITQAAILLGARVIERHFSPYRLAKGSDHVCSVTSRDIYNLKNKILHFRRGGYLRRETQFSRKKILELVGNDYSNLIMAMAALPEKSILPCELKCKMKLGKSIVAARDLRAGQVVKSKDIDVKISVPSGVRAEDIDLVVGRVLINPVKEGHEVKYIDVVSFREVIV